MNVFMLALAITVVLPVEDLPLIDRDTTAFQTSSHNKRGGNGDGGWSLYAVPDATNTSGGSGLQTRYEPSAGGSGIPARHVGSGDPTHPEMLMRSVIFDAVGPGCIANLWGLGYYDLRVEVDGRVVVAAPQDDFYAGRVPGFPKPLVFEGLVATGPWDCRTHWSFVPIPFRERCVVSTLHPKPFDHVIAERYRDPSSLKSWRQNGNLDRLTTYFNRCGQDPKPWRSTRRQDGQVELPAGQGSEFFSLSGKGAIGSLRLRISPRDPETLRRLRLQAYWDDERMPSVDAPIGHFFAAGVRWQDVPSLLVGIDGEWGYCYLPMPFWSRASLWLVNDTTHEIRCDWRVEWRTRPYPRADTGYFRTWFHAQDPTPLGEDYLFLHTRGRGQFVGVVQTMLGGHWCEGDERFYVDGSRSPAFYGTGTEDYYLAACWPTMNVHSPFHGTVGDIVAEASAANAGKDGYYRFRACYYRFHLEAPVRFESEVLCGIEHGGTNDTHSSYTSLAYYYQQDRQGLVLSDTLHVGSPSGEAAHALSAPSAERYPLRQYFEGDHDDVAVSATLLAASEPLRCMLKVAPRNLGVRLRRVLDQKVGRQWAEVWVDGRKAGDWYTPDENAWKRWVESDFEIAPRFVKGKRRMTLEFRPRPGAPPWTLAELRAYSHVSRGPR